MFSHSFCVKASDLDEQGHVNNVTYLRWIQDVAVAHWLSVAGEDVLSRYTWVVTRHEIDYKREAFEGDEITVETCVGERTRVTWDRHTKITSGEKLLAEARTVWCLVERERGRPAKITDDILLLLS